MARYPKDTTIGVLGGGQLGRMLALSARRMGYRVIQWIGHPDSGPAGIADEAIEEAFDDEQALAKFLDKVDVVTVEFENIPSSLLQAIAAQRPLYPPARAIEIAQHREREKGFLTEAGVPCVPYIIVSSAADLAQADADLPGEQRVLKTSEFGYDGKGQVAFAKGDDTEAIWQNFPGERGILEQKVDLAGEISVLIARNVSGQVAIYDPAENIHTRHILDLSIVPARVDGALINQAKDIAQTLCEHLDYVGLLAVEFFITKDGALLANEMAPRPHNSGHHTIDACYASQFEQQLRGICDLPLGDPSLKRPVVMWNLLGDVWPDGAEPDWAEVFSTPGASLHLYGKHEARVGRKMGHINVVGDDLEECLEKANGIADRLGWQR